MREFKTKWFLRGASTAIYTLVVADMMDRESKCTGDLILIAILISCAVLNVLSLFSKESENT